MTNVTRIMTRLYKRIEHCVNRKQEGQDGHDDSRLYKGIEHCGERKQEGHDGPALLHWLIRKIPTYQTLPYLGNWFNPLPDDKF